MTPRDSGRRSILFQQAVDLDPEFLDPWAELSNVYVMLYQGGDGTQETLDLAAQALARAEAIDPDNPLVILSRGYYHYLGHLDYDEALVHLRKAEKLSPNDASVSEAIGYIMRRQGDFQGAIDQLNRALQLDPNNSHLHLQMGGSYSASNQYALADAAYDRSIALFPGNWQAYLEKAANIFFWRGSPEEALTVIDRIPDQDSISGVLDRVHYLTLSRQYDAAEEELATISPVDMDSRGDQMRHYLTKMDLARAKGDRESMLAAAAAGQALTLGIISDEKPFGAPYLALASFEAVLGQRESALEHVHDGMELGTSDHFFNCGAINWAPRVYALLGDEDPAIDLLAETLDNGCFWRIHRNELRLDPLWDGFRDNPGSVLR